MAVALACGGCGFFYFFFPANQTTIYDFLAKFKTTSRANEVPKVDLGKVVGRALHRRRKSRGREKRRNKGAGETKEVEKTNREKEWVGRYFGSSEINK